jgi:hypothetical protein
MMLALARLPIARLTRTPRAWLPVFAWSALAVAAALVNRSEHLPHGADRALLGVFGSIALPLVAYAVVGGALGGDGLRRAGRPLVAFGAPPARAAFAIVVVTTLLTAVLGAALGALVAALAHAPDDPPLAMDALTTAWTSALSGAAYASLFCFGAAIGARGAGRGALLALDWIVGSGSGAGAFLFPRAHLRNLHGGDGPLGVPQWGSSISLCLIAAASAAFACLLARRD